MNYDNNFIFFLSYLFTLNKIIHESYPQTPRTITKCSHNGQSQLCFTKDTPCKGTQIVDVVNLYEEVNIKSYLDESIHQIDKPPAACCDQSMHRNMGPNLIRCH